MDSIDFTDQLGLLPVFAPDGLKLFGGGTDENEIEALDPSSATPDVDSRCKTQP